MVFCGEFEVFHLNHTLKCEFPSGDIAVMPTVTIISRRPVAWWWYFSKGSNTHDYCYVKLPLWHDLVIGTECTWSFNSGCIKALHGNLKC